MSVKNLTEASKIDRKVPVSISNDLRQTRLAPLGFVIQGYPDEDLQRRMKAPGYVLIAQDLGVLNDVRVFDRLSSPYKRLEKHRDILQCHNVIPLLLYVEDEGKKKEDSFIFCILSLDDLLLSEDPESVLKQVERNPYSIEQQPDEHVIWNESKQLAYYVLTGEIPIDTSPTY